MPLLEHPVVGSLRRHRVAVELTGETDREVTDIDHLLDLTLALGDDLAHFEAHQLAELTLVLAQLVSDLPHDLAAARSRYLPPLEKRPVGPLRNLLVFFLRDLPDVGDDGTVDRARNLELRSRAEPLAAEAAGVVLLDAEFRKEVLHGISIRFSLHKLRVR